MLNFTSVYLWCRLDCFEPVVYVSGAALLHAADGLNKFKRCYHKSIKCFLGTTNITLSLLSCLT